MPENKEKKAKKGWSKLRDFLLYESYKSIFYLIAGGDVHKEEEMMFKTVRVFHIIALALTPIAVTVILVILSLREDPNSGIHGTNVIVSYVVSFFTFLTGVFWHKVISWRVHLKGHHGGLFINHSMRLTSFWFILLLASLSGAYSFATFYAVIPLIVIYTGILIYTFPTKKKWCKWSDYTSLLCD